MLTINPICDVDLDPNDEYIYRTTSSTTKEQAIFK